MFIHLHTHSYFSFLDGILSPEELVKLACENNMNAIALTDHDSLTGAIEFYDACQENGIKPILGLEITVSHPLGTGNIVVLAKDITGWSNICRISSCVHSNIKAEPHHDVAFERLHGYSQGIICLSGGKRGIINRLVEQDLETDAIGFLRQFKSIFCEDMFIEIQSQCPNDTPTMRKLVSIGRELQIQPVATNNVHYRNISQATLQRTVSAIKHNIPLNEIPPSVPAPEGCFFTSDEVMRYRFKEIPEAIINTIEISEKCNLTLPVGQPHYPEFKLPSGDTVYNTLNNLVKHGAKARYGELTPEIKNRLDYEMEIIHEKGYAPLFLIVKDVLDYARKSNIPISSRGSAASSLVAHCLDITTPDPLALNLHFERFLNPARTTPPDIDTDICSKNRDKVIRYVYDTYGNEQVAMVATIIRYQPRSALREVAKAHGLTKKEIADLTASLDWRSQRRNQIKESSINALRSKYSKTSYQTVFDEAKSILGFPRHLSVHPGGIIISPGPIRDLVPTHMAAKGIIITQFDLGSLERLGLVKIDLLGSRGLTVLGDVASQVRKWRSTDFTSSLDVLDAIQDDDADTQRLLHSTQTIGCFSIESPGMRTTLREINAGSIDDIMIALALYRPGPMTGGLKDSFVRRHRGKEPVSYIHPSLTRLLEKTHGVILYQEQVLRIASEIAGLSLTDADLLRRAMSHFDPGDQMRHLKSRFLQGALEISGIPEHIGEKLWDLMAAFAGYGFPKAHAASYAQLAWRSMWCKAHFPAEFMASVLANGGGYYRQSVYINETKRLGIRVSPPHINHSKVQFSTTYPKGKPTIYMGLNQVRELTQATIKRILSNRPYFSLDDFLTRVDPKAKEVENLIKVGGFARMGTIPSLLSRLKAGGWRYAQPRLFDLSIPDGPDEDWDIQARVAAQKEILGIGVDAHPVELAVSQLGTSDIINTTQAKKMIADKARIIGIKQTAQRYQSQEYGSYVIVEIDDSKGVLPIRLSSETYSRNRDVISSVHPFLVEGVIVQDTLTGLILLETRKIIPLGI